MEICSHLNIIKEELDSLNIKVTWSGQPWSQNCRFWIYYNCIIDTSSLKKRLSLDNCVKVTSNEDPTYFTWKDQNGDRILTLKKLEVDPPWTGYFSREESYTISPVQHEMQSIFASFCKEYFELDSTQIQLESFGDSKAYVLNLSDHILKISYFDDLQSVYISPHFMTKNEEESRAIIRKLGEAFNRELEKGKFQDLFTGY